jgi:hypothetical protein
MRVPYFKGFVAANTHRGELCNGALLCLSVSKIGQSQLVRSWLKKCILTFGETHPCRARSLVPTRCQRLPVSRVTRSSSDKPMAAMPLARIARQLAAQGNIKISKSGMNLSGQNNPASPNARPSWTTKHSPRLFTVPNPMREVFFIGTRQSHGGEVTKVTLPDSEDASRLSSCSDTKHGTVISPGL